MFYFIISPLACCHICKHQYCHSVVHQLYRWWPALHYKSLPAKLISVRMILHISIQLQTLPRNTWTYCLLKWNYFPRLQKPCISTRHYISCPWHKQSVSSNATAVFILIELSDDNKTAGATMFSWLLCVDITHSSATLWYCEPCNVQKKAVLEPHDQEDLEDALASRTVAELTRLSQIVV